MTGNRLLELEAKQQAGALTTADWIELSNFFLLLGLAWWQADKAAQSLTRAELFAAAHELHQANITNLQNDLAEYDQELGK